MRRIKDFSRNHIIAFSSIVTLAALLVWSIEWDGDAYMGFDMILSHVITCIIAIWLMKELSILHKAGFQKNGFSEGLFWGCLCFY